ncbi:MAG: ABC transporter permease [Hormoscilla sp. GM102CHS1]|nr:ABC transporter permease [Hormoscilla sp. GM102CHS1]
MASIARKNLLEDIPRFLVAQAGIMFAVSLVTIQIGILKGFTRSTVQLIENSPADIWVASQEMLHLELTKPLLLEYALLAKQVEGVDRAEPLMRGIAQWNVPGAELTPVKVFGFDPEGQLFLPGKVNPSSLRAIKEPYTAIVDASNLDSLHVRGVGDRAEIGSLPVRLVGLTKETQSIVSSSFVFTSLKSANAYLNAGVTSKLNCKLLPEGDIKCVTIYEHEETSETSTVSPPKPLNLTDPIVYVLIRAKPGEDLQALKRRLEAALPDSRAYTRAEMANQTRDYWQQRSGIGFILGLGAAVGVIVGMVVVGQILYSSVSDHLKEFGTLKAMGASDWVIYSVIIEQAMWMAVIGYVPSMILCLALASWALASQGIMILITPLSAAGVLGITLLMCVGSAFFAIQKVTRVDPAIVFKA